MRSRADEARPEPLRKSRAAVLAVMRAVLGAMRPECSRRAGRHDERVSRRAGGVHASIDVAHVEAGLRAAIARAVARGSQSKASQCPGAIPLRAHRRRRQTCLREGVDPARIHVTGKHRDRRDEKGNLPDAADDRASARLDSELSFLDAGRRLIPGDRASARELGPASNRSARRFRDRARTSGRRDRLSGDLNPNVQEPVRRILDSQRGFTSSIGRLLLVRCDLLSGCELVLTDSGGVQEEA